MISPSQCHIKIVENSDGNKKKQIFLWYWTIDGKLCSFEADATFLSNILPLELAVDRNICKSVWNV